LVIPFARNHPEKIGDIHLTLSPSDISSDVNKTTHVKAKATTPKAKAKAKATNPKAKAKTTTPKAKATGRNSQGKIVTLTIKAVNGMLVCLSVWPQFASATNRLLSKTMLLC